MSLSKYNSKRNFTRTAEPRGAGKPSKAHRKLAFVVQKHAASRLHYDFRLELDGVLKSWAIPKGPSLDPSKKSLAVEVEDHPLKYAEFEGVIPAGEYGGGAVLVWDRGIWKPLDDPQQAYQAGKLRFELHGEKLKGEFALIRMRARDGASGKEWLLIKSKDKHATKKELLESSPLSVKTNRTIEDIANARSESSKAMKRRNPGAKDIEWPTDIAPQLAVLADAPPAGSEWLHEIKFDGYRFLAFVQGGQAKLISRNGKDWTGKFLKVAGSLAALNVQSAIIDGEAVVLDDKGKSDFQSLQGLLKKGARGQQPIYYSFDLLYVNGQDLRALPLLERKSKLERLLQSSPANLRYSDHVNGDGDEVIRRACDMSLEGIISKQSDAPYVGRRDPSWIKSKCHHRQEFVIIGFTNPNRSRTGFGALLLGYHDESGKLQYAGRVGTGFDKEMLKDLSRDLGALERKRWPTDAAPPARETRHARWVKPTLVCEVRFTEWTSDGSLRHPAFIALRTDKPASKVVREKPLTTNVPAKSSRTAVSTRARVVEGISLTHPEKLYYPQDGVTKGMIADYYLAAQDWILPHLVDRPLALLRCPSGAEAKCFFQRNYVTSLPKAVNPVNVGENGKKDQHLMVSDLQGLLSLVQIGALELHTWNCHQKQIEHPDQLVFDLDPAEGLDWRKVIQGARDLRKTLEGLGLSPFLKTSGGKGLHLTVPIQPTVGWDATSEFCANIAKSLAERSSLFVANMRKELRVGRIFIDYHRNTRSATAVAPYSTRARRGAPVSMPISWEELGKLKSANHFTVETAGRILEKRKSDPWKAFERSRVDLLKLLHGKLAA